MNRNVVIGLKQLGYGLRDEIIWLRQKMQSFHSTLSTYGAEKSSTKNKISKNCKIIEVRVINNEFLYLQD